MSAHESWSVPPVGGLAAGVQPEESGGQKPKRSGKTNMRTYGLFAAAAGVLFTVALLLMLGGAGRNTRYVIVAKQSLPAQQLITLDMLDVVEVAVDDVNPMWIFGESRDEALGFATGDTAAFDRDGSPDRSVIVVDRRPVVPVLQGQEIRRELLSDSLRSAAGELNEFHRIISITVPAERAAGGMLRPGDYVDIVTVDAGVAGLVAEMVEIVGVQASPSALQSAAQRQTTDQGREEPATNLLPAEPLPGVYVLQVPNDRAISITAAGEGNLHLLYRSITSESIRTPVVDLASILSPDFWVPVGTDQPDNGAPAPDGQD